MAEGPGLCRARVLGAAAVTLQLAIFLAAGPLLLAWVLVLAPSWAPCLAYLAWWLWDLPAANTGGRRGRWVEWCRGWRVWRWGAGYFPITLVKTAELPPHRSYLVACHPHGVLCFGASYSFLTEALGARALFPGVAPRLAVLEGALWLPVLREFLLGHGAVSSSRRSLRHVLAETGQAAVVMVGGVPEMCDPNPGEVRLHLLHRKGFVKAALEQGSPIVPCFVFGEAALYRQQGEVGAAWRGVTAGLRTCLGIAPVLFAGQGWIQHFGFLPRRRPLRVVVGAPVEVARVESPSREQVEQVHQQYVAALTALYDKHNMEKDVRLVIA